MRENLANLVRYTHITLALGTPSFIIKKVRMPPD
jgi:hypothetical protein